MVKQLLSVSGTHRRRAACLLRSGMRALPLFAGMLLLSCTTPADVENAALRVGIVPDVVSRVAADRFEENDAIGLSIVPWQDGREQSLAGTRWEDNVRFVFRGGVFEAVSTPYFPDATTRNTLYAYYPYDRTGFVESSSQLGVAVATDQRGAGASASDYLVAVTRNVIPDGNPVPLVFRHVLSQISIRLTAGPGMTTEELARAEVTLKNFHTEAVYDAETGTFSDSGKREDIIPFGSLTQNDTYLEGLSAILVPQTRRAGESLFYIVLDGVTMAYKQDTDFVFESGRNHLFTATVGKSPQGVAMHARAGVADWRRCRPATEPSREGSRSRFTQKSRTL